MMTSPMADDNRSHHPPPWLFGLVGIPYGVGGGFAATTMPFLARKAGISVSDIGWYGTALLFPPIVQFLYAPIVDIGPKRKHWLIIVAALGSVCFGMSLAMPLPSRITAFLALAFVGQTISGLVGSCNGGLLATTMPDSLRGAAGGWLNVGNLTGGALGAWLTLVMAVHFRAHHRRAGADGAHDAAVAGDPHRARADARSAARSGRSSAPCGTTSRASPSRAAAGPACSCSSRPWAPPR